MKIEKTVLIFHKRKEFNYSDMKITFVCTYPLILNKPYSDEQLKKLMSKSFKIAHPDWKIVKVTVE